MLTPSSKVDVEVYITGKICFGIQPYVVERSQSISYIELQQQRKNVSEKSRRALSLHGLCFSSTIWSSTANRGASSGPKDASDWHCLSLWGLSSATEHYLSPCSSPRLRPLLSSIEVVHLLLAYVDYVDTVFPFIKHLPSFLQHKGGSDGRQYDIFTFSSKPSAAGLLKTYAGRWQCSR